MDKALGRFAEHLCQQARAVDALAAARHADPMERNVGAGCRLRALADSLDSLRPAEREYVERMTDDEMAQFAHALKFYDPLRDSALDLQ